MIKNVAVAFLFNRRYISWIPLLLLLITWTSLVEKAIAIRGVDRDRVEKELSIDYPSAAPSMYSHQTGGDVLNNSSASKDNNASNNHQNVMAVSTIGKDFGVVLKM